MSANTSLLEEAFHLYLDNAYIAVPMIAAIVVTAIAMWLLAAAVTLAVLGAPFYAAPRPILFLAGISLLLVAVLALVSVVADTIAGGMVAELALSIAVGGRMGLAEAWERVKPRALTLVVAAILAGIVSLILSIVPVVGLAVAETLFAPVPLLVVKGRGAVESMEGSARLVLDSLSRRAEVPLAAFVIFLLGALNSTLGILVSLLGYPYVVLLYALYAVREGVL